MYLAFVLGRTPDLARQEIESVAAILPFQWSLFSVQGNILLLKPENTSEAWDFSEAGFESEEIKNLQSILQQLQHRLGGTVKIVYLAQQVDRSNVTPQAQRLVQALQKNVRGKRTIGISVYSKGLDPVKLGMSLKKQLRTEGEGLRIVLPQGGSELNSAQILHNKLSLETGAAGVELNIIPEGESYWLGITATTQDIEFYTKRDFHIPHPDPISGMLPPKLAQSMVNIVVGTDKAAVYDPFCGNGRVVLESWLMGLETYGSDIVEKKVWSANENLKWLSEGKVTDELCWFADATGGSTPSQFRKKCGGDYVLVGEPYLGRPLHAQLKPAEKAAWLADITPLYEKFLETWAATNLEKTNRPQRMLLVFPRAKVEDGSEVSTFEALVDTLNRFGYSFEIVYCYDRSDSYVRRDLVRIGYK